MGDRVEPSSLGLELRLLSLSLSLLLLLESLLKFFDLVEEELRIILLWLFQ